VTCEEIEAMRVAVQNTLSRLQHKGSSDGCDLSQYQDVAAATHSYQPKESDNDALSSASSTCTPESRVECWADAVDDDVDSSIALR
jgi:hypothetical protein